MFKNKYNEISLMEEQSNIKFKTNLWNKVRGETYIIEVRGIKLPLNWDEAKKIYETLDYEINGRVARRSIENTILEIEKNVSKLLEG